MHSAYCRLRPGLAHVPLLFPNLGPLRQENRNLFLDGAYEYFTEPIVQLVDRPEDADLFLIPHHFPSVHDDAAYLGEYAALSAKYGKPIVAVNYGDAPPPLDLPNSKLFISSTYRSLKRPNDIIMPAYAQDLLGLNQPFSPRPKSARPVISFCGWSDYKNVKNALGTMIGNALVELRAIAAGNPRLRAQRKGISFRREALAALQDADGFDTNFIVRRSYSGHSKTISLPPDQARREYIENMRGGDLALVVKGDGNYSYRFYEALSLGRIPLFVDTETPLPLEDTLDYSRFILRVDFAAIPNLPLIVREWWKKTPSGEIERMQQDARAAFTDYLRADRFFAYAFEHLL